MKKFDIHLGSTLFGLENKLAPYGREPHSVPL
jgi:hypothetical protein